MEASCNLSILDGLAHLLGDTGEYGTPTHWLDCWPLCCSPPSTASLSPPRSRQLKSSLGGLWWAWGLNESTFGQSSFHSDVSSDELSFWRMAGWASCLWALDCSCSAVWWEFCEFLFCTHGSEIGAELGVCKTLLRFVCLLDFYWHMGKTDGIKHPGVNRGQSINHKTGLCEGLLLLCVPFPLEVASSWGCSCGMASDSMQLDGETPYGHKVFSRCTPPCPTPHDLPYPFVWGQAQSAVIYLRPTRALSLPPSHVVPWYSFLKDLPKPWKKWYLPSSWGRGIPSLGRGLLSISVIIDCWVWRMRTAWTPALSWELECTVVLSRSESSVNRAIILCVWCVFSSVVWPVVTMDMALSSEAYNQGGFK